MRALFIQVTVSLLVYCSALPLAIAGDVEPCPPPEQEVTLPKGMSEIDSVAQAIPLQASGSAPCGKSARDSLDSPASCCTPGMLTEIKSLGSATLSKVDAAEKALANPSSQEDLLWKHFRVKPSDTARIQTIRARLSEIADSIRNSKAVTYYCRDSQDDACGGGKRRAATENCSSSRPPRMWFCGSYESSKFFNGPGWLRTFVHEHAHAGCHSVGEISSAGTETYNRDGGGYPPATDKAIKNADSYASFALEF